MKKIRQNRRIAVFVVWCLVLLKINMVCYAKNQEDAPRETELYAKSAVLMDADSGRILYEKNGKQAMANASTTKILTCITALEYCETDAIVTASGRAAAAPKVHLGMQAGQRFYMLDLLHALMLESYNDCAVAIAEHVAGSVEDFAAIMNRKAAEIGCKDTYFITPNGLDATDEKSFHHTTAADLALLMRYCISGSEKSEEFRKITAARTYNFCEIDSGRTYSCYNRNAFLDMMQGAFSGKTGFTGNAGYCYVGALSRDGKNYIVALLACGWPNNRTYKWSDSKKLMQYGIDFFEKIDLTTISLNEDRLRDIPIKNGQTAKLGEIAYTGICMGDAKGLKEVLLSREEEVKIIYQIKRNWEAPIAASTYVGRILLQSGEELLMEYPVFTTDEVKKIDYGWCFKMVFSIFLSGL